MTIALQSTEVGTNTLKNRIVMSPMRSPSTCSSGLALTGAVFFLASPDADFITGQTLNVDGGMFMN